MKIAPKIFFSDHIVREILDIVFVKRSQSEMTITKGIYSLFWNVETFNVGFDKSTETNVHLYSIPVRDLKVGESIFNQKGEFIAYRNI